MHVPAEKLKSRISAVSLFISIIASWLIVPLMSGFPIVAFFIFFVSVGTLVFLLRKNKTWFDTILYFGILLLSFFTIYRANQFLQFFDFIFIIFFGSLLIKPILEDEDAFTILF